MSLDRRDYFRAYDAARRARRKVYDAEKRQTQATEIRLRDMVTNANKWASRYGAIAFVCR